MPDSMLDQLLQDADRNFVSVFLCGGTPDPFQALLPWLRTHINGHYLEVPADGEAEAYLRAFMRQDPDGVLVDQRGSQHLSMLFNILCTGHRLFSGHPQQPQDAFQSLLNGGGDFPAEVVGQILEKTLLLAVNDQAQITCVYQIQRTAQLVPIAQLSNGAWQSVNPPSWGAPIQAAPEDFSPIEIPEDWTPFETSLLEKLRTLRKPKMRTTWAPVLEASSMQDHLGTHFGGVAALLPGESWPRCQACQQRMLLVAQIESQGLPTEAQQRFGPGTLQLFYCIDDGCNVEQAWGPFAGNSLSRLIPSQGLVAPASEEQFLPEAFPCHQLQSWVELQEGPDWEESDGEELDALRYTEGWSEMVSQSPRAEGLRQQSSKLFQHFKIEEQDLPEIVALSRNYRGDKLFGWPSWSQAADYPNCRQCNSPMEMLLQINNDGPHFHPQAEVGNQSCFGQIFAGDGIGHVHRCPNHPEEMTFSWAGG